MKHKFKEDFIKSLQNNIIKQKNCLWLPKTNIKMEKVKTNSWFDLKKHTTKDTVKTKNIKIKKCKKVSHVTNAIKVELFLNDKQKYIINNWLNACTKMYNKTIEYIRNKYRKEKKYVHNFYDIRKQLYNIKHNIINKSTNVNNNNSKLHKLYGITENDKIKCHILDASIKMACSNLKTSLTNKKNGLIRSFRLRFLKFGRKNRIMRIEKSFFGKRSFCRSVFGNINSAYNCEPFNLDDIVNIYKSDCLLKHDSEINKYFLYVPQKVEQKQNNNKKEFISIDPGIRSIINGISEDEVIIIGENVMEKIKDNFKKIKCNEKIKNKSKQKYKMERCKEKLQNQIDDMHWKIINFLTGNYKNILLGNMSTKSIICKGSKFSGEYKKMIQKLRLYQFKEKLEYKCLLNKVNYKEIKEHYTSMMCSNCGFIKKDLGSSKIYNCTNCKIIQDRDINGARNIYFKRLLN